MAVLVELGPGPVNETERRLVRLLVDKLPAYWRVFPNISLKEDKGGQPYEYDVVLLTGHAVYVMEIKGWRGLVRAVSRRDWQLEGGRFVPNPLPLNEHKARVLASRLNELSFTHRGRAIRPPHIRACLVTPQETKFDVLPEDAEVCLKPSTVGGFVSDPERLPIKVERDLYQGMMRKIVDFVAGTFEAREILPPRYQSYVVTQTVDQQKTGSTHYAKHAEFDDGRLYRVRTRSVSRYMYSQVDREQRLEVLKRGAQALHRIGDHPNVVTLRAFGQTDDGFFEVTDWSDTGTLATALALGAIAKLTPEKRLEIFTGIARGLAGSQDKGVHHRDLRPEAILLGPDGQPKIGDFDLAFIEDATQTVYGSSSAVPIDMHVYRAPELRDPQDYDVFESTDLYSLGRLAFDLFAGVQPEGDPPPRLDEIPEARLSPVWGGALSDLVERMLEADPNERPSDAAEVLSALEALATPSDVPAPEPKDEYAAGDLIDDQFLVIEVLRREPNSTVYLVENDIFPGRMALELAAKGEAQDAPLLEFQRLRRLDNPGVVTALWAGRTKDARSYVLLEFLKGPSLADRLAQGPMAASEAAAVMDSLRSTVEEIHRAGLVVGRGLAPEKIFLLPRGPVLADFSGGLGDRRRRRPERRHHRRRLRLPTPREHLTFVATRPARRVRCGPRPAARRSRRRDLAGHRT